MRRFRFAISTVVAASVLVVTGSVSAQWSADVGELSRIIKQLNTQAGKHAEAVSLAEKYVALAHGQYGDEDPQYATALLLLAGLYKSQDRYAEAELLYKRALAIIEKTRGPEHLDVSNSLKDLAELYEYQGRYDEAEPLYKRVLAIREKVLGPEHRNVGDLLKELAWIYERQDRYAEAEPLLKRELAIREKALGLEHRDAWDTLNELKVAVSLASLAALYRNQGRYAEAEPLEMRARAIIEKAKRPSGAQSSQDLASKDAEAVSLAERDVALAQDQYGDGHTKYANAVFWLAILYEKNGRYAEVEPLYKRALVILEKVLGPEHPDVRPSLTYLAAVYRNQGRYAEAEPLYKRALVILEKVLVIREKVLGLEHLD